MEELVFRDADVVDGSGEPSYRADVVIDAGRIVSIVQEAAAAGCQRPRARRELDAEGLVLSPGFIDMHAHSDLALLRDPDHSAKAAQGVTLEVLGQDGLSYAPVDDRTREEVRRAITGWNGHGDDIDFDWRSVGEYLDRLDRDLVGRTVRESAQLRGENPWTTARLLLLQDDLAPTILQHVGHEENVQAIMRHPLHTGGSDGILQGTKPHPRAYGTFPQYLGRYVRELGVLSLEECVAHLTSRPAARLRLPDRGLVREGYRADLVLFDPATVAPGATYDNPRTLPKGIPYVLVDGRFVIEDGRRTDVLAGRAVRRSPVRRNTTGR